VTSAEGHGEADSRGRQQCERERDLSEQRGHLSWPRHHDVEPDQGKRLCEPSQKGFVAECLQPHQATVFGSVISAATGEKPPGTFLCEPSQKGWLCEWPQAHQYFVPGLSPRT
jgi:hypothetical protein